MKLTGTYEVSNGVGWTKTAQKRRRLKPFWARKRGKACKTRRFVMIPHHEWGSLWEGSGAFMK